MNLRNFDQQKVHFGFSLGYNNATYAFRHNRINDTIKVLEVDNNPGFNIGLVSVYHASENVKLKFMPEISFQRRLVEYEYDERNEDRTRDSKEIESTIINLPLLLKLRTQRINNFAAAILLGGNYGIDVASQEDVKELTILKAKSEDLSAVAGVGLDFFLQYFKLGLELKYAHGFYDLLVHDGSEFSRPIDYLQSRVWTFTITFEGSW